MIISVINGRHQTTDFGIPVSILGRQTTVLGAKALGPAAPYNYQNYQS